MTKISYILCDPLASFGDLNGVAKVLRTLKELGYQGFECNLMPTDLPNCDELLGLAEEIGLPAASFLTGANYFGQGLCLSSPQDEIRRQAVECLCSLTKAAPKFGAVLVVGQMQGFKSDEPNSSLAEARIEQALRQVADCAETHGTTVVVEPVNHLQCGFHNTFQAVRGLTQRIGSSRVKPMLDSFHINIEEQSQTEPILLAGQDLGHFHLCESNGGLLGSGHLDVAAILRTLRSIDYQGFVSVKVYREPWERAARATMEYLQTRLGA